ncbi:MAG: dihydropteroate synthase [Hyphomicrobiales bacterium]
MLVLRHARGSWDLTERARVIGILNLTPDSFYDGGRYVDPAIAIERAEAMVAEGADAIDVGAQSTRPGGGPPLTADQEWDRLCPVLPELTRRLAIPVSVDTFRADVARRALEEGAAMVNDVSGLTAEPSLADQVARTDAALVLMHALGAPDRMHAPREYDDPAGAVRDFLEERLRFAIARGVPAERIALDPGIGFSKRAEQSLAVLRGLPRLTALGRPVYIGLSRKSFLGHVTGRPAEERLAAGLGATVAAVLAGARIVRTHDVRATVDALAAAAAVTQTEPGEAALAALAKTRG